MAVRRLAEQQPDTFAFSSENLVWAKAQIEKYPEGRQASAVIPILWRAQEQEGWVSEPAIRTIADMLDMAYIRVLEVATFYTMFQLSPVGTTAHIQVCGTTPCMLRGSDDIIAICKRRIAETPHARSADGRFSWEEVECLGACVNAPMIQMVKDTYEDLTAESFEALLDTWEKGETPKPGPQNGRTYSMPTGGPTSLTDESLFDGSLAGPDALSLPEGTGSEEKAAVEPAAKAAPTKPAAKKSTAAKQATKDDTGDTAGESAAPATAKGEKATEKKAAKGKSAEADGDKPAAKESKPAPVEKEAAPAPASLLDNGESDKADRPATLDAPEGGKADDLKQIKGIGPKIEGLLHELGVYHFAQVAAWNDANKEWVDDYLRFKGRIDREDWIAQARVLAEGGETEFSKRVEQGDVPTSKK